MGSALNGEFEVIQKTAATDIWTFTGASGQSGDFMVCRDSTGSEKAYITSAGAMTLSGALTCTNVTPTGYVATKHATTTIALTDLGTNGGLGVGILTGTAQLYFRQNGTLYRLAGTAA